MCSTCSHGRHTFRAYVRSCLSLPAGCHPDILVEGRVRGQARVLLALWQRVIPQPLSLSRSPLTAKCLPSISPGALHTGAQMCVSFGSPAAQTCNQLQGLPCPLTSTMHPRWCRLIEIPPGRHKSRHTLSALSRAWPEARNLGRPGSAPFGGATLCKFCAPPCIARLRVTHSQLQRLFLSSRRHIMRLHMSQGRISLHSMPCSPQGHHPCQDRHGSGCSRWCGDPRWSEGLMGLPA